MLYRNDSVAIFICPRGEEHFLSTNIFCGVFVKKRKEQWKEWDTWKIHILKSWTKTAGSFFSSCQAISIYDSKKPQFDIGFRTKWGEKTTHTLSEDIHGIPTDTNIKHRRMESDRPVKSLLLAHQVTSSTSLYLPNV